MKFRTSNVNQSHAHHLEMPNSKSVKTTLSNSDATITTLYYNSNYGLVFNAGNGKTFYVKKESITEVGL